MMSSNMMRLLWTSSILIQALFIMAPSLVVSVVHGTSTEADEIILVTNTSGIYKSQGNASSLENIPISDVGTPFGIDVDVEARVIFWTDTSSRKIKRVSLDGGNAEVIASTGTGPRGIAVDPADERIFWADTATDSIETVKYDGSDRRRLIYSANRDPTAVAVDTEHRKLYWINTGSYTRQSYSYSHRRTTENYREIMSAHYNGQQQREIVDAGSVQPRGIAINADGSRIYWCENSMGSRIKSKNPTTGPTTTILDGMYSTSCSDGLAWHGGQIYWTNSGNNGIGVVDVTEGGSRQQSYLHRGEIRNPIGIFVGLVPRPSVDSWNCTFDKSSCGWTESAEDAFNWQRLTGAKAESEFGGPALDFTRRNSSGKFFYATSQNETLRTGDTATLISPLVNASGSQSKCFRFWYHMGDATRSSLKVFFRPEEESGKQTPRLLWAKFGAQEGEWIGVEVPLKTSGLGNVEVQFIVGDATSSSVAIDNVHMGYCREASRLVCGDTSMTVYLDRARFGILDASDVTLTSSECHAYEHDSETVAIRVPYGDCGTIAREKNGTIVFSNAVTASSQPGIRRSSIEVLVNCSLRRNYQVDMTYLAHSWIKYISEEGVGDFSVGIQQYPDEKLEIAFPSSSYPQQVDKGDTIYMATEMSFVKDVIESHNTRCWATGSPDSAGSGYKDLIDDGCPVDGNVRVISSEKANFQPFSFKAFTFDQPDLELIYVHCDVIVCRQSEESACHADCNGTSRSRRGAGPRLARGVRSGPHTVTQGPFISRRSSIGSKGVQFNLNSVLLIVACVCLLALTAAIGYSWKNHE